MSANRRLKVVHIITRMIIGGAQENTLFNAIDLIRMYGDEVTLITGIETGPEGDLLEQGRGGELDIQRIPELRRAIHPLHDRSAFLALKSTLERLRPDVVHTHSAKGGFLGRWAAWQCHVPAIVHTVHGAPFHPYQSWLARTVYQQCERFAAKRCHALISVADAMTDLMVSARIAPRSMFHTIYSGMDVEPFLAADSQRKATRQALNLQDEHVVIGKIARLFHLKGHEYLVRAAEKVIRQCPQVRFLLVGDGLLRESLERELEGRGVSDYFRFTGLVSPEDIPKYLGAMDGLVHCSLREGLARALPQALIAGKPVVSFDVDGAREVCLNDQTGFLIAPKDEAALASAIIRLAEDSALRERMGTLGRKRFAEQFRHQTMTRQIRDLYLRVLERGA
jgi:glycosyltransferase involved in cell wall biosynthesis